VWVFAGFAPADSKIAKNYFPEKFTFFRILFSSAVERHAVTTKQTNWHAIPTAA